MRRELERVEIPGEHEARTRARAVVLVAFSEREPTPHRRSRRPVAALAAAVVVVAGLLSPPGRAVLGELRAAVGVERAQPALFSLPAPGRLLVSSDSGAWIVDPDGSKRLLGDYREASWSPFGRFVVAARRNELAALEPDGGVRWTVSRQDVRSPRWTGSPADTRIAYVDRLGLRVVAGDGRRDRLLAPAEGGALAWRPGPGFELAYVSASEVRLQDVETGGVRWRANAGRLPAARALSWSADGSRLLVVLSDRLLLLDGRGRELARRTVHGILTAALSPDGGRVALARRTEIVLLDDRLRGPRRVFAGGGRLEGLTWSQDGRWVLTGWPAADQWVFVRVTRGEPRIVAVSNVSAQFRSGTFPRVEGWCCAG
ncbi:MAG: hypothetical protein MSC30_00460 [Gaiellaceae bacterium MAG52_C11]|nr:hypothetical protein [Candidatus Gaiellasilicea maunaloa]